MSVMKKEKIVSKLREIAAASLRANIITLPSGRYLAAGQNQFLTLWTRDFCHAVRGLLTIGEDQVAKDHLSLLLKSLRPTDGLVPRVLDNQIVQWRVAWQSGRKLLPFLPKLSFKEPLKPQYTDEHGSHAVDSNLLVLLASLQVRSRAGGESWWAQHETELMRAWHWYDDKFKDGLIWQTPFADWQDSAKREGHAFLTNLFYFLAGERLRGLGWAISYDAEVFKDKLKRTFVTPSGVFSSLVGSPVVSVDGNLFALEAPEFLDEAEKKKLWADLLAHPLVKDYEGVIGVCSTPEWPVNEIAWHVKFARLHRYHGELAWSWLMGLGLRVTQLMGDDAARARQLAKIRDVLEREGEVVEIHDPLSNWTPWGSWLLRAERPFSWGAGYMVESLDQEHR
jgi:hypothetical protein